MDFTTRCPACGSIFSGAKDQLKRSDGWVRCASCSHVFDAMVSPPVEAAEVSAPAVPSPQVPPPAVPPTPVPESALTDVSVPRRASADTTAAPAQTAVAAPARPRPQQVQRDKAAPREPDELAVLPEPRFVRQARRRAFWHSPGVRASLGLLALLLSVLLIAQWAFQHRDRLAATQPALAPWLAQACELLGCALEPVRRLEAIVIDSTALVRRLDDAHGFDIVLNNVADMALAMPALELTLTRWDGSVLARRVFLPEELPDAPRLLPARALTTLSLRLSLPLGEDAPLAGYRALVFYP
jgi:predicted Zn finger-like uncharacterized protein